MRRSQPVIDRSDSSFDTVGRAEQYWPFGLDTHPHAHRNAQHSTSEPEQLGATLCATLRDRSAASEQPFERPPAHKSKCLWHGGRFVDFVHMPRVVRVVVHKDEDAHACACTHPDHPCYPLRLIRLREREAVA